MPELPEVETVRAQMQKKLPGKKIARVEVRKSKSFVGSEKEAEGETIEKVERVGKYLFVHFKSGKGLGIHLKMTGRLVYDDRFYEDAKHTRVVMTLENGKKLFFWDTRIFGYIKTVKDIGAAEARVRKEMGPEPWKMTEEEFYRKLKKTGRAVKNAILDQKLIAGVGNIYANDSLWRAGIRPMRTAKSLTRAEAKKLLEAIRQVMERGKELGGASDNTYRDFHGEKGSYQNEFLVYGGGKCKKCGRELTYLKVGGRGTWMCEVDQK